MKKVIQLLATAWALKALILIIIFLTSCAGRVETMRYTKDTLPSWILDEWRNAQDEILALEPPVSRDPRSISPYRYDWIQLEKPFMYTTDDGRRRLNGLYDGATNEIIICCGYRETVRHEAFHAILDAIGDPRWTMHYPELKPFIGRKHGSKRAHVQGN